jgi:phosphoglucosamine mutase
MRRDQLPGQILVATVLSNAGLEAAVVRAGGRVVRTAVGDRYIIEAMTTEGAALGGEKSGHVIIRDHAATGDGTLTALMLLDVLARTGAPLAELASEIELYPQVQRNVVVRERDGWEGDAELMTAILDAERQLAGRGRVLVRPSGTEPALRIMVEGSDAELVARLAERIATVAEERLH